MCICWRVMHIHQHEVRGLIYQLDLSLLKTSCTRAEI